MIHRINFQRRLQGQPHHHVDHSRFDHSCFLGVHLSIDHHHFLNANFLNFPFVFGNYPRNKSNQNYFATIAIKH